MTAALALEVQPVDDELDTIVESAILRFLNGESEGQELLHALYDAPLHEPIPYQMLDLVRSHS